MEIIDDNGRWSRGVANCLSTRFDGNRQERKKHAKLRGRSGGALRAQSLAIRQVAQNEQKAATIMRQLEKHLGLLNELELWGRGFKIRANKFAQVRSKVKAKSVTGGKSRRLPSYRKPLVDSRGRIALFMAITYAGLRSAKWRAGLPTEHILYICRVDALEAEAMSSGIISSMGVSASEIAQAWQALEEVEKAYRANAIVQHRIVVNLPHALSPAGRERALTQFCKKSFGRYGLPYVAVPHMPDPGGDSRNFHGHVCISARPMERTGDHEWMIGEEKISGFTDPAGLIRIRAEFAAVLNRECRREGLDVRYTHQSYKERGIDARRQEHYGPERTALHRNGETVDMVGRNQARVERNETKVALAVVNIATAATTKFEELVRRRLALLEKRKMLKRRMTVIDGVLSLIDEVSHASDVRAPNRSARMKAIAIKRPVITNLILRIDRVAVRSGLNGRHRDGVLALNMKRQSLASVDQHLSAFIAKVSTPSSAVRAFVGGRARRGQQFSTLSAKFALLGLRAETVAKHRARFAAIKASIIPLSGEISSFARETLQAGLNAERNRSVDLSSQDFGRVKPSLSDKTTDASFALDNAKEARVDDIRVARPSNTADADNSASDGVDNIASAGTAVTGSLTTEPSTIEPTLAEQTATGPDHVEQQSARQIRSDDASPLASAGQSAAIDDNENTSLPPLKDDENCQPSKQIGSDLTDPVQDIEQSGTKATDGIASDPNIANASQTTGDLSGKDEPFPSAQDGAKAEPATVATPAHIATAAPPADEHDLKINRFETAQSDAERRISAVAIRADKIALARMAERKNPQWAAIDEQFQTQQRIAATRGGGIGG